MDEKLHSMSRISDEVLELICAGQRAMAQIDTLTNMTYSHKYLTKRMLADVLGLDIEEDKDDTGI